MALAQHGLGFMYLQGEAAPQDSEQALQWLGKAAAQGLQGSMTTIAMMYEQGMGVPADPERAKHWYRRAGF